MIIFISEKLKDIVEEPLDLVPLVNNRIKKVEEKIEDVRKEIYPLLQLMKNNNPKFGTTEGYFFFSLLNQLKEDISKIQKDVQANVNERITSHFSRMNITFRTLVALTIGLILIVIGQFVMR